MLVVGCFEEDLISKNTNPNWKIIFELDSPFIGEGSR